MVIDHSRELAERIRGLCAQIDGAVGNDDEIQNLTTQLRTALTEYLAAVRVIVEHSYPKDNLSPRRIKPEAP